MELFTEYFNYICDVVNYIINYCIMNVKQILVYYQKLWTISFQMIPYLQVTIEAISKTDTLIYLSTELPFCELLLLLNNINYY